MPPVWRNWAGDQVCAPSAIVRPAHRGRAVRARSRRAARARRAGPRRRLRPLVHRLRGHRRRDDRPVGDAADPRGRSRRRPGDGPGRGQAARARRAAGRARPRAREPGRHRSPVDRRGDLHRHPRHRRAPAEHVGPHRRPAAGRPPPARCSSVTPSPTRRPIWRRGCRSARSGVISAVTIQCVPLYTLHRHDEPAPLAETLDRLDEHVDGNDHFEFFVFPYTDTALTRTHPAQPRRAVTAAGLAASTPGGSDREPAARGRVPHRPALSPARSRG